jgi:hypothetical protein
MTAPAADTAHAPTPADTPAQCLNCAGPLATPRPRYCPACGQETALRPPTVGEFLQQFGGSVLATEGALWRTLRLLLLQPGALTQQYLAGRRRHYVLPLRLYLTVSVVVLLLMRLLATMQIDALPPDQVVVDAPTTIALDLGAGRAGMKDGVFYCEQLPQWLCQRLQRRIDLDPKAMQREARALSQRFVANIGAAMFLLLPAFALGLRLVYPRRGLRYTEHLVFALHVHAFWFLMLGLSLLPWSWLEGLALLAVPVYTLLAMRRVYGGRWWPRLLRAAVVSVLYGVTLLVALAGVGVWALLF